MKNGQLPEKNVGNGQTQEEEQANKHSSFYCSTRFIFTILGFSMFIIVSAQRACMSVAIVCMINHTAVSMAASEEQGSLNTTTSNRHEVISANVTVLEGDRSENEGVCADIVEENKTDGEFVWSKTVQGHILGSFFYGYMVSQIPASLLAVRFGGKWVLFGFTSLSSLSTLFTPLAARHSYVLLIVLRLFVGIGSGAQFPIIYCMLGHWSPPLKRSRMVSFVAAGFLIGVFSGMLVSGVLCKYGFDSGWGSIFYILGGVSVLVLLAWAVFSSDTPASNRFMSRSEKLFIADSLQGVVSEEKIPIRKIPWLQFLTSGPVWALITVFFCADWGFNTLLMNIPTFYKEVLKFDITVNGVYSAIPFLAMAVVIYLTSPLADRLQTSRILSVTTTRKVFSSAALFTPAIFLIALSFLNCTQTTLAVVLLTVAVGGFGFTTSGYYGNHIDIAPKYAGILMAITNTLSSVTGFVTPAVAAALTQNQDRQSWQKVFFIAASVCVFGGVFYLFFGSGIIQPWAVDNSSDPGNNVDKADEMYEINSSAEIKEHDITVADHSSA